MRSASKWQTPAQFKSLGQHKTLRRWLPGALVDVRRGRPQKDQREAARQIRATEPTAKPGDCYGGQARARPSGSNFVGFGQPLTRPLLVREGDRYAEDGHDVLAHVVYFLAGVRPVDAPPKGDH